MNTELTILIISVVLTAIIALNSIFGLKDRWLSRKRSSKSSPSSNIILPIKPSLDIRVQKPEIKVSYENVEGSESTLEQRCSSCGTSFILTEEEDQVCPKCGNVAVAKIVSRDEFEEALRPYKDPSNGVA